jgi:hypothetical protein
MIDGTARLQSVRSDAERDTIQNNLTSTDRKLNALVYELYGIAKGDQQMIEEGTAPKLVAGRKKKAVSRSVNVSKGDAPAKRRKEDLQPALF